MTVWSEVGAELAKNKKPDGSISYDLGRRRILTELSQCVQRPVLVYAVDFLNEQKVSASGRDIGIDWNDKEGFNEATLDLPPGPLDVVLHSPGGIPEAAESIVAILRNKFSPIRFIIPNIAKSAATMLALSGDEILMDSNAELGPIDPQFVIPKGDGSTVVSPAQAIKDQFEMANDLLSKNPTDLPVWIPILQQYGPSLLKEADNAMALSQELVIRWLVTYMFAGDPEAQTKAEKAAKYFSDHNLFKTHSRRIGLKEIRDNDVALKVVNIEEDRELHRCILRLYSAISHTFGASGAYKMFENSQGQGLFRLIQVVVRGVPGAPHAPPPSDKKKRKK